MDDESENVRIKNDSNENNCYINIVTQIIYHLEDLKNQLLDIDIYLDSPEIIKQLILLLSSYSIAKTKKNCILQNKNFRNALSTYFKAQKEFQLNQEGDPVELIQIIFNFIHTYIITKYLKIGTSEEKCNPICLIHNALYIDLKENLNCTNEKCNYKSETKYDSNYFIHLLNVPSILNIIDTNLSFFTKFNQKLIESVNLVIKQCPKCNSRCKNHIICNHSGKYFLFQLIWENDRVDFKKLLKIFCMINCNFKLSTLFDQTKNNLTYIFEGLVLFYLNHYICLFYEKNQNLFVLYDDLNIEKYKNWDEVVHKLLSSHYLPILLIYENESNNHCIFNLNEQIYDKFLELCEERDNGFMIQNSLKLQNDEWNCEKCGIINKNNNDICKMCGYKNNFISLIIQQEKIINQSKQSSNKPIENTKNKNNLWKCNKCGTINKNDICIKCEKKKERNIKFNSVDYKKINKNQDSSYNYYDSEENSKINENKTSNHSKISYSVYEQKFQDNPFDIPRENTFIIPREKEILFSNIINNKEKKDKIMNSQYAFHSVIIQNEWICPFCKSKNKPDEKCGICGRRNNKFNKNNISNQWECPKCKYINKSIKDSICNNCHYLYNIIATMNNQRDKIIKNNSIGPMMKKTINLSNINEKNKNNNNNMENSTIDIINIKPIIKENNNNNNKFRTNIKKDEYLNKFLLKK